MSTLGDVQYIGRYHEYIRGCSVHQGDIISTSRRYHECIRGDIMRTLGDVQYIGLFSRH